MPKVCMGFRPNWYAGGRLLWVALNAVIYVQLSCLCMGRRRGVGNGVSLYVALVPSERAYYAYAVGVFRFDSLSSPVHSFITCSPLIFSSCSYSCSPFSIYSMRLL